MSDLQKIISAYSRQQILLIGDIMLDRFIHGDVSRISPEGPIPILKTKKEDKMLGGAGNVYANLCAMGCDTNLIGIVGHDEAAQEIQNIVSGFSTAPHSNLIQDSNRPTILKTRYLSQNQQLLRVDQEDTTEISSEVQKEILQKAEDLLPQSKVLILSDYGKGTLTKELIKALIKLAKKFKVPVIVDPKGKDFSIYKGAQIVTPNRKELSEATNNMATKTNLDIESAAQALVKQSGIETVFATRSEDGISVIGKKSKPLHLKTQTQEVYDVSGAGDTVVAAIAATIAAEGSYEQAAEIANIAGGLAVAKVGTAIIRQDELIDAASQNTPPTPKSHSIANIRDWQQAKEQIQTWQAQGLKVGFTGGCFDILHYGHVNYLEQARQKCDRLVVGVNHDKSVKILKGETRPINDELARGTVIAALGSVDMVALFGATTPDEDNTPIAILDFIRPDILMKGGDYTIDQLPEAKTVLSYGGKVEIMPLYEGYSTTNIIKKSATP